MLLVGNYGWPQPFQAQTRRPISAQTPVVLCNLTTQRKSKDLTSGEQAMGIGDRNFLCRDDPNGEVVSDKGYLSVVNG